MTVYSRDCKTTIMSVQAAGDGEPGTAAAVDIPSPHTMLLVELPSSGVQAIKFPEGNVGDQVDVFVVSRTASNPNCKLRVWDADNNNLAGTDEVNALAVGNLFSFKKITPAQYSSTGFVTPMIGTWLAEIKETRFNYASS